MKKNFRAKKNAEIHISIRIIKIDIAIINAIVDERFVFLISFNSSLLKFDIYTPLDLYFMYLTIVCYTTKFIINYKKVVYKSYITFVKIIQLILLEFNKRYFELLEINSKNKSETRMFVNKCKMKHDKYQTVKVRL